MKHFLLSLLIALTIGIQAQTATSIGAGNWLNPLTWDCSCVPVSGYSVTINHSVTLNTSMSFSTGGVTINNAGSLVQDANRDIYISGGYFYNNGTANFRFYAQASGTGSNSGTFSLTAFTNSTSFVNTGNINLDSIYVAASFTNSAAGKVNGNRATNASAFLNDGRFTFSLSLNTGTFTNNNYHGGYAFTNSNLYDNSDSLEMSYSMWNRVKFNNKPGATVKLTKRLHNTVVGGTAVFDNQANVVILDSWYNTDTVKGTNTGTFTVADTSANSGHMKGNFKFCDQTAPGAAPYVDLNSGTISPNITWCAPASIKENEIFTSFTLYPNPNNGTFYISARYETELSIFDASGRMVEKIKLDQENDFKRSLELKENGIYFISGEGVMKKLVVIR
jgi:hypothetical protein